MLKARQMYPNSMPSEGLPSAIPALMPRGGSSHQFVVYADSCSGVPGTPEETAFARVNAVVSRLRPQPEFICFPGDEIIGLSWPSTRNEGGQMSMCGPREQATFQTHILKDLD